MPEARPAPVAAGDSRGHATSARPANRSKTVAALVSSEGEDERFLTSQLITCIGNKRRLRPLITRGIMEAKQALGKDKIKFLDLFAGSGFVSRLAKRHASLLVANDLERYSRVANECYLANADDIPWPRVRKEVKRLNQLFVRRRRHGFISELYAPRDENGVQPGERVFYTKRNAAFLDTVIPEACRLDDELRPYVLAPLVYQASVSANTSGVFKGFHKNGDGVGQYGGRSRDALARITRNIAATAPVVSRCRSGCRVFQCDANELVENLDETFDIAYLDPPYNQHPYGSNYFMLNLLCDYKPPENISRVAGIPDNWNRSVYNKRREAQGALFHAIEKCPAKFILVSYNSEGFVKPDEFVEHMRGLGRLRVLDAQYNTFRGCRNLRNRGIHTTEYLFLLDRR